MVETVGRLIGLLWVLSGDGGYGARGTASGVGGWLGSAGGALSTLECPCIIGHRDVLIHGDIGDWNRLAMQIGDWSRLLLQDWNRLLQQERGWELESYYI